MDAGFASEVETVTDHRPAGTVVTQTPEGGTDTELGSAVLLGVSDGEGTAPLIPDVAGLSLDEARLRLTEAGLDATVIEVPVTDDTEIGRVVGQRPAAGTSAEGLDAVTVEVGRERRAGDPEPQPTASPSPSPSPATDDPPGPQPGADPDQEPGEEEEPLPPRPILPPL